MPETERTENNENNPSIGNGATSAKAPTFYLGLTMAGAVSAGAYTAGVLDYLFRAIDAHNRRVDEYYARLGTEEAVLDESWPRHRVVVKVMSGASAGSVCAGLAVAGLIKDQDETGRESRASLREPTDIDYEALKQDGSKVGATVRCALRPLYDVWVDGLDLWRDQDEAGLLGVKDLADAAAPVASVFDSTHIGEVAANALSGIARREDAGRYDFLAEELDLFMTTTDLKGISFVVDFGGGDENNSAAYRMAQHSIVRHFRLSGLGMDEIGSPWLDAWGDDGMPLDVAEVQGKEVPFNEEGSPWWRLKMSAVASGAFPIGLAAQRIDARAIELGLVDRATGRANGGAMALDVDLNARFARPTFLRDVTPSSGTPYIAVDGGVGNNEPFEHARFALRKREPADARDLAPNPRDAGAADRAVIMIDPFPEGPEYELLGDDEATRLQSMVPGVLKLFPTLIEQARFKPAELVNACDPTVRSRFLIAPRRSESKPEDAGADWVPSHVNPDASGAQAIACGAFSGFAGFFARSFRLHDYVLGQRNCQRFLMKSFTLAAHNPVLGLGADHPEATAARAAVSSGEAPAERPVIDPGPGFDVEVALPVWPSISQKRVGPLFELVSRRLKMLGERLIAGQQPNSRLWMLLGWLWNGASVGKLFKFFGGFHEKAVHAAYRIVLSTLAKRDQHAAYRGLSPEQRLIVLALIHARDKPKTARELIAIVKRDAPAFGLGEKPVAELLEQLQRAGLATRPWSNLLSEARYTHLPH